MSLLDQLEKDAIETLRLDMSCLDCSYFRGRKYKLCDECFALWLETNGYDPSGARLRSPDEGDKESNA